MPCSKALAQVFISKGMYTICDKDDDEDSIVVESNRFRCVSSLRRYANGIVCALSLPDEAKANGEG